MLNRALVVDMNYLGDALMTTPALSAVHVATGTPSDVIAGGASGYGALEILRGNPDIAELIARIDGNWWARCVQLWRLIRSGKYNRVIILPSINVYRWTARLAGAKRVIYVPPAPADAHLASHMLEHVSASLGIAPEALQLTMPVSGAARARASNLLAEAPRETRLVGLNIGATRPQKRWPNQAFASLAVRLASRGCTPVLLGGPGDGDAAEEIRSLLDTDSALINLCGKTSIPELAAVIECCDLLVTGDSGAMHIASAVGTPIVALFGSTDPAQTGPIGAMPARVIYKKLHCAPCKSHPTCGGTYDCMKSISPSEVLSAVLELLGRRIRITLPVVSGDYSEREP